MMSGSSRWSFRCSPALRVVAAALCLGGGAFLGVDSATARPGSRSAKAAPTAKLTRTRGAKRPTTLGVPAVAAWKGSTTLSVADRKRVLASAGLAQTPGTIVAQVSPADPLQDGAMALMSVHPEIVNPMANYAVFPAAPTGGQSLADLEQEAFAGLWLKSAAPNAKYLVDCALTVESTAALRVRFDDGKQAMFSFPAGQHHATWVLDSPDANWHSFRLRSRARWSLHGCAATRL